MFRRKKSKGGSEYLIVNGVRYSVVCGKAIKIDSDSPKVGDYSYKKEYMEDNPNPSVIETDKNISNEDKTYENTDIRDNTKIVS